MTATPSLDSLLRTGPFHAALRAAIRRRGLTLDRLRSHLTRRGLSVALSTLSDWQSGRVRPAPPRSREAVAALEEILCLPHRALSDLLDRTDPPDEFPDLLEGFRANDLTMVARQDTVFVDAAGRETRIRGRIVCRARHDGADRFHLHYWGVRSTPGTEFTVTPIQHCRLGRVVAERGDDLVVVELLFDHTLQAGDTWVFEYESNDVAAQVVDHYGQGIRGCQE